MTVITASGTGQLSLLPSTMAKKLTSPHITVITASGTGQPSLLPSAMVKKLTSSHITVITASGTGQTVSATFRYGGAVGT